MLSWTTFGFVSVSALIDMLSMACSIGSMLALSVTAAVDVVADGAGCSV